MFAVVGYQSFAMLLYLKAFKILNFERRQIFSVYLRAVYCINAKLIFPQLDRKKYNQKINFSSF